MVKEDGGVPAALNSTEDMLYQQSMEARLQGFKERVDSLKEENAGLKRAAAKAEKDTHEFVAYFQNEMEKKDQLIAKISEQMTMQEINYDKESKNLRKDSEEKVSHAENELSEYKASSEARLKILEDELAVLTEYKHKRNVLNDKLQASEARQKAQAEQHTLKTNAMERTFIEKTAKLQREVDKRIEDIKRQAREDAQAGLDADTRKVISDNRRMSEELRFQLQTTDELQQQGKVLVEENKRLKREIMLANDKEKECASRGYYKDNQVTTLKNKIKSMEKTLSQTIRDFEHDKKSIAAAHANATDELTLEVAGLKQLVKLKNKELANLRNLAQVILDQRTEVEQYFLEALEQVKQEIRSNRLIAAKQREKDYRKQMRIANNSSIKFPLIQPQSSTLQPDSFGNTPTIGNTFSFEKGVKIELRDLSWQDRERVLRLLFAKINSVENQAADILKDAASNNPETTQSVNALSVIDHSMQQPQPHPPL